MTPEYRSSDLVKAETCRHGGEPIMKFSVAQGEQVVTCEPQEQPVPRIVRNRQVPKVNGDDCGA
jgi:hypothetical protein